MRVISAIALITAFGAFPAIYTQARIGGYSSGEGTGRTMSGCGEMMNGGMMGRGMMGGEMTGGSQADRGMMGGGMMGMMGNGMMGGGMMGGGEPPNQQWRR